MKSHVSGAQAWCYLQKGFLREIAHIFATDLQLLDSYHLAVKECLIQQREQARKPQSYPIVAEKYPSRQYRSQYIPRRFFSSS